MGYYKNKQIEEQVEVGDRVPQPRPASTHVAWSHTPSLGEHRYYQKGDWQMVIGSLAFLVGMGLGALIF